MLVREHLPKRERLTMQGQQSNFLIFPREVVKVERLRGIGRDIWGGFSRFGATGVGWAGDG